MTIGIIPLIAVELILAVSIYLFATQKAGKPGHRSIQQVNFPKKYHSPIQIRPPPIMVCAFNVFLLWCIPNYEPTGHKLRAYGLFYLHALVNCFWYVDTGKKRSGAAAKN